MIREYKPVEEISGPLMMVRRVENVTYDELVEIELHDGSLRRGKVLEVNGDRAVVQLFENSAGINLRDSKIRFLGHPLQLAVSEDMLGRVFDGSEYRGVDQGVGECLAKHSGVPVYIGLSDVEHPTQIIAEEQSQGVRVAESIELLDEADGSAALFGGVIEPLAAADGDAVVAGKAFVPAGCDELFSSAAEELLQVHRRGSFFLLGCKRNVL